jgi:hypothetical protein
MTVTDARVDLATYWSIVLSVAQWRRNPQITQAAIVRLRGLGVPESEILARRRATSGDGDLAALLRLAVTIVISRDRLVPSDLSRVERRSLQSLVPLVRTYTADALAFVRAVPPAPVIDMDVGDY